MILATLGTHPQPMDRLLRELDALVHRGLVGQPILVQTASVSYRPRHAELVGIVSPRQLSEWVAEADVVVTHGGPGTIFGVLAAGRIPVVVPRRPEEGEHVDDHQVRFTKWLVSRRDILPVFAIADLYEAIREARGRTQPSQGTSKSEAVRRIREIIQAQ